MEEGKAGILIPQPPRYFTAVLAMVGSFYTHSPCQAVLLLLSLGPSNCSVPPPLQIWGGNSFLLLLASGCLNILLTTPL